MAWMNSQSEWLNEFLMAFLLSYGLNLIQRIINLFLFLILHNLKYNVLHAFNSFRVYLMLCKIIYILKYYFACMYLAANSIVFYYICDPYKCSYLPHLKY